jgi:hypothetical protein
MPKISSTKTLVNETADLRMGYPTLFPIEALGEIRVIAKRGDWLARRATVAKAVWELVGFAQGVIIDGEPLPEGLDYKRLAEELYQTRESIHAGIRVMIATTTGGATLGGDARDPSVNTSARFIEAVLQQALAVLPWLRKLADTAAGLKT